MDSQFSVQWRRTGRKAGGQEIDWLRPSPSGFGRLLASVAIIGVGVCLLDHAAGKSPPDTFVVTSTYVPSQQGR